MDDLFNPESAEAPGSSSAKVSANAPLAARFRPRTLEEYIGQGHLLAPGKPLRRLIEADRLTSLILFGPPGVGKTSLAEVIARRTVCHFERLNGVEAAVSDLRRVLAAAVTSFNGIATDQLTAVPTDELKVTALHQAGITQPHAVFGNSIHDAAMLSIARSASGAAGAFPVNPNRALVSRAAQENWPLYYPASVTP